MPVNQINWSAVQSNAMSNALNMAKAQEIGRNRQAQNIMTEQAQQGIGYRDSANALSQQGFHDAANTQIQRANAQDKAAFEQQKRNEEQTKKLFKGARNQKQLDYAFAGAQELGLDPQRIEMMKNQLGPYQKGVTEYKLDGMLGENPNVEWKDIVDDTGMYKTKSPFYKGVALPPEMFGERNKTPRWQTTATLGESEQKLGLSKSGENKLEIERMDNEKSLYRLVNGLDSMADFVKSPDYIGSTAGDLVSTGNSLVSQFKQLTGSDLSWDEISDSDIRSGENKLSRLRKAAINGNRLSALEIELAYTVAKMVDPSSKITDKDFIFAKKMLSSGADKRSVLSTLNDLRTRQIKNYNMSEMLLEKNKGVKPRSFSEDIYKKGYSREDVKKEIDYKKATTDELLRELLNAK